jgi:hypothetical protein
MIRKEFVDLCLATASKILSDKTIPENNFSKRIENKCGKI